MILFLVFAGVEAVLCILMKLLLRRENKKLIAWGNEAGVVPNLYTL